MRTTMTQNPTASLQPNTGDKIETGLGVGLASSAAVADPTQRGTGWARSPWLLQSPYSLRQCPWPAQVRLCPSHRGQNTNPQLVTCSSTELRLQETHQLNVPSYCSERRHVQFHPMSQDPEGLEVSVPFRTSFGQCASDRDVVQCENLAVVVPVPHDVRSHWPACGNQSFSSCMKQDLIRGAAKFGFSSSLSAVRPARERAVHGNERSLLCRCWRQLRTPEAQSRYRILSAARQRRGAQAAMGEPTSSGAVRVTTEDICCARCPQRTTSLRQY